MAKPAQAKEKTENGTKMVYIRLDLAIYERILKIAEQEDRSFSFIASRILAAGAARGSQT